MPTPAVSICDRADEIDPGGLLALLAVVRGRTSTAAATTLGVNHTTVARRIRSLEQTVDERLVAALGGRAPTARGREVLLAAEAVQGALDELPSDGRSRSGGVLRGLVHNPVYWR